MTYVMRLVPGARAGIAARVDVSNDISADRVEDLADDIDRRLADRLPLIPHGFIDPTQTPVASLSHDQK
jgi:hypothetical protein